MKKAEEFIRAMIQVEGGYVNHPLDRGGPTKYGITLKAYREVNPAATLEDLRMLSVSEAEKFYFECYFILPQFNRVARLNETLGMQLLDMGVNQGRGQSSRSLQRALNLFNKDHSVAGATYPELVVDGKIGNSTIYALSTFLNMRGNAGASVLQKTLNVLKGFRYIEITEERKENEEFIFGWFANRVM